MALPASGVMGQIDAGHTNQDFSDEIEAFRDHVSSLLGGNAAGSATIASGSITPAVRDQGGVISLSPETSTSDDLDTVALTNLANGQLLMLRSASDSNTITLKDSAGGSGQMIMLDDADVVLSNTEQWVLFRVSGTDLIEITRHGPAKWVKAADVASASALPVLRDGNYFSVTGTTAITSIAAMGVGTVIALHFADALVLTHHATDLNLGGANILTYAGYVAILHEYAAGDWRLLADNRPTSQSGTPQNTTSGTAWDFTDIPPWATKIDITFANFSTDGTSNVLIQLGDAGGLETTGYSDVVAAIITSAAQATATATNGFLATAQVAAAGSYSGTITLTLQDKANNRWTVSGGIGSAGLGAVNVVHGFKSLSAILDRLRITTVSGDTGDLGVVNTHYRG